MPVNTEQKEINDRKKSAPLQHDKYQSKEVDRALKDVEHFFGFVPSFVKNLADQAIPGAWGEAHTMRFSSNTALEPKLKGLIGLAVGSQIPCEMITYFEQSATLGDGATMEEQREAVIMAAITRHWSTILNGSQLDKDEFRKEADGIMDYCKKMMASFAQKPPTEEMFLVSPTLSADQAYQDMEKTLGCVPKFFKLFPLEGIAAAWSEFKGFQLNPFTVLNGKQKELIGLAVAAQIPCDYCIYFHKQAALLNDSDERELREAIAMAGVTRHWSTIFHGPQMTFDSFKKDADRMVQNVAQRRGGQTQRPSQPLQ